MQREPSAKSACFIDINGKRMLYGIYTCLMTTLEVEIQKLSCACTLSTPCASMQPLLLSDSSSWSKDAHVVRQ
jgi:hypothetical protein